MHGAVFAELEKFVVQEHSQETWYTLVEKALGERREFDAFATYPDTDVLALVGTASEMTEVPVPALLEAFGRFLAADLLQMYWGLVEPGWKSLDVIEHTEANIHKVVRLDHAGATPPKLKVERRSPTEVFMAYDSPRKMCQLAKGLAHGLADHYGETIVVTESQCMHDGAAACHISFRTS